MPFDMPNINSRSGGLSACEFADFRRGHFRIVNSLWAVECLEFVKFLIFDGSGLVGFE